MYISGLSIGLSALDAARAGIAVTGQNIANVSTQGYHRQEVNQTTRLPFETSAGFFGRGVQLETVRRVFNEFLDAQVASNQASVSHYDTYMTYVSQLDSLLGEPRLGLTDALGNFFDAVSDVSADADDMTRRSVMLSRANTLVDRFRTLDSMFGTMESEINANIRQVIPLINQYATEIASLNQNIAFLQGSTGNTPNDLMDRRDELVRRLNEQVGATVSRDANGSYNIFIGGQSLVIGSRAMSNLQVIPSTESPGRVEVAVNGVSISNQIGTGGALGGLMAFRTEVLDSARNQLGRVAIGIAEVFNDQHRLGLDLNGQIGGAFFTDPVLTQPIPKTTNVEKGVPSLSLDDVSRLTESSYRLQWNGSSWGLATFPAGTPVAMTGTGTPEDPFIADGLRIVVNNLNPTPGDSWLLQPTRFAAGNISMAITDPSRIAAAQPGFRVAASQDTVAQLDFSNWTPGQSGTFTLRVGRDAATAVDVEVTLDGTESSVVRVAEKIAAAINTNPTLQSRGISALADPGTQGLLSIANVGVTTDFSTVGSLDGSNVQTPTAFDFSGAGLAQFDVKVGALQVGITLTENFSSAPDPLATPIANLAATIQAQLQAVDPAFVVTEDGTGLTISRLGDPTAVEILATDTNALAAGFADSPGSAGVPSNAVTFSIDGQAVTLDQPYLDNDGVAAAIQSQLTGYTVTWNAATNRYDIRNNLPGSNAPAIVATNANADAWDDAGNLTAVNTTGGTLLLSAEGDLGPSSLYVTAGIDGVNDNVSGLSTTAFGITALSSTVLRADNDPGLTSIDVAKALSADLDIFSQAVNPAQASLGAVTLNTRHVNTLARLDPNTLSNPSLSAAEFTLRIGENALSAQDLGITINPGDAPATIAANIVVAINGNANLRNQGISAVVSPDSTVLLAGYGSQGLYISAGLDGINDDVTGLGGAQLGIVPVSGNVALTGHNTDGSFDLAASVGSEVFSQTVDPGVPPINPAVLNNVTFTVTASYGGTPPTSYDLAVTDAVLGPLPPILGYTPGADLSINGWSTRINAASVFAPGDSFTVSASPFGVSDNRNGNLLAELETKFSMLADANGKPTGSFASAYGLIISQVANRSAEAQSRADAHSILFTQVSEFQQSVSGVNLDEEAANLVRYQQNYAAAAKLIQVSGGLFDTLLDAMR